MNRLLKQLIIVIFCFGIVSQVPANAADAGYYNMGATFYAKGEYVKAAACFQQALRAKPLDANCLYFMAVTYQRLGNLPKARQYYEAVVRVAPETPPAIMSTDALKVIL